MRKPLVLAAVAVATVALAAPALAGPKLAKAAPLTVRDVAGDANFVNGQGVREVPGAPVPSIRAGADILSVSLGRTDDGKKVKALTASMTLSAPPEQGSQFRIAMSAPGCSVYYIEFEYPVEVLTGGGTLRENCSGESVFNDISAAIDGNTIKWSIPVKSLPGGISLGTVLSVKYGQTNLETAAIIPAFDEVQINKTFKVGQ